MKTKQELEEIQNEINREVEKLSDPVTGATAKVDGIVDIDQYLSAELRIMWVLKEVNSSGDSEEWNMIDTLRSWSGKSIDHQWRKTFDNILYTTNGILTQTLWEDQQDQDKHPEVTNQLSKISYCNVKKVPGASQTNMSTLERYYNASEKHVLRQINELEPQVIIFGGTYDILEPGLDIMHYKFVMENDLPWYYSQDQIILNARHPQSTSGTRQKYCDNIIKAVINWKNMNG